MKSCRVQTGIIPPLFTSKTIIVPDKMLFATKSIDDDKFRFNDASTHEGHLRQNSVLTCTWFCNEMAIIIM